MQLVDWIVIAVLAVIVGGAVVYLLRAKRKGVRCIGCPYGESCQKTRGSDSCSCNKK